VRTRAVVVLGITVALLAGCGGASHLRPPAQLIGFDTYYVASQDFEATRLVKLDPGTLRPVAGRGLKLGDSAAGGVLGPDGRTYAVGGVNFGEVMLVDLAQLRRTATISVQRSHASGDDIEVDVVGWPAPHRLVAVVGPASGKYLVSERLAIIDPAKRLVLHRFALPGTALAWANGKHGRTAILVASEVGRIRPARLLVVGPSGNVRHLTLARIPAGATQFSRTAISDFPSLTSDGRRAYVVDAHWIASVDLATLAVTYHAAPTLRPLAPTPPYMPGSSGLYRSAGRSAQWLGKHRLLLTGSDDIPVRSGAYLERTTERQATIVDTDTWRVVRRFAGATSVRAAFGLWFGGGAQLIDKRQRGSSLIVFRPDGTVLYRKRQANLWWTIVAGKLIAGNPDGSWLAELDPRTGKVRRILGRLPVWPFDALTWRPRR